MIFGQAGILILAIAALALFTIGFLLGPKTKRHPRWPYTLSGVIAVPWILWIVLFGAYVIAAGNPQNTDRPGDCCSAAQAWAFGIVAFGVLTFAALVSFWLGMGFGWMLRIKEPQGRS